MTATDMSFFPVTNLRDETNLKDEISTRIVLNPSTMAEIKRQVIASKESKFSNVYNLGDHLCYAQVI